MRRGLIFLAVLAQFQGGAWADGAGETDRLDHFLAMNMADLMAMEVSISTQSRQKLSKAPAVVTVVTAEDIQATGATNVVEVLQSVPGVYIRANLFGFRPLVTMRGATGTHTLLMVDGAPIKDLVWHSGIFWKGLPTHMIDRIEIIRGPGSALYGSDASAGAINIITKTSRAIEKTEAGLRAGSFDTQEAWFQRGGIWQSYEVGFTAALSRTDGHDPYIARHAQTGTGVADGPGHAEYGWNNMDVRFSLARGDWRLQGDYTRHGDLQTGFSGAAALDDLTEGRDERLNLALLYNALAFAPGWSVNGELRFQHLEYTSGDGFQERPPGFTCAVSSQCRGGTPGVYADGLINQMRSAERRWNLELSGLYSGFQGHALRLGSGYVLQDLYSVEQFVNFGTMPDGVTPIPLGSGLVDLSDSGNAFAPEQARKTAYAYLQDVWAFSDAWELTAGLRYDHYSDFGGAWNPRLALVWQTTDRLTTKLLYGEAFRAPSYLELYAPTSASSANPDLKPETSRTLELSFSFVPSQDWRLGLNLYQFDQYDLIGLVAGRYENRDDLRTRGFELEAQWQATPSLVFAANYSRHRYDDPEVPVFRVPEQRAYLRADWNFMPRWHWNLQANWIDRHELEDGDVRAPIGAYTLVDTTLRHAYSKRWEFAASVRNLFDEDARELSSRALTDNLPLPGRSLFAEVRYRF
ncbi:MAG: TonB-dependent receptor [Pseudomonadota bacterium]